jgi:hypothetical protein
MPGYYESIAYGNGKFIAVGRVHQEGGWQEPGKANMAYSTDGITWTDITDKMPKGTALSEITFCGGKFFAYGGWPSSMATSTDGENWTVVVSNLRDDIKGIAYGNGKYVFVTYEGTIRYSTDGITWTAANRPSGITQYQGIAYGGGKFVAVTSNGRIAYSADGVTWTAIPGSYSHLRSIAYGDGKFVAGGWGHTRYSSDGVTWTEVAFEEGRLFYDSPVLHIAYGGGKFVASGDGDRMAYSADGITWTDTKFDIFSGEVGIRGIAYGAGKFVAVGIDLEDWNGPTEKSHTTNRKMAYSNLQE